MLSKLKCVLLLWLCLITNVVWAEGKNNKANIPTPTGPQLAWQEAELGVVFHYDLHIFDDKHYNQTWNRITPRADIDAFNPTELDTDQWVRTAKEMGARFAILTASHETGFRLWQSDVNPYSLKSVKWGNGKRDIVAEFIASCKKYDIKPAIYMGTRWNSQLGIYDFKVTKRSTITQEAYNRLIEKEVEEICSRYGDLFELWFDGGAYGPKAGGPDVLSVFEKHQPNCLFYHNYQRADARWGGSESGTVPYPCWATMPFDGYAGYKKEINANGFRLLKYGNPNGKYWCPAMSDAPLRSHEWFWDEGDGHKVKSLNTLVNMYYNSVGRNSTLIVGLTPDKRGLMPDADVNKCREFGRVLRNIFSNKIGESSGRGNTMELTLPEHSSFDHVVIQEDIRQGERVRRFKIEYYNTGKWTLLTTGTCIGHKRIIKFKPVTANKLRLTVEESIAEPIIRILSVYDTQQKESIDVYILSGQSNMQGLGKIQELPINYKKARENTFFWNGQTFEILSPGTTGVSTRKDDFGPEISFSSAMEDASGREIYLIKYYASGQALHHGWNINKWMGGEPAPKRWNFYPGKTPQDPNVGLNYVHLRNMCSAALKHLKGRNTPYDINGFIWMQGEQDSKHKLSAAGYALNLKLLKRRLEEDLNTTNLLFIYGQVLPHEPPAQRFTFRDLVRRVQANAHCQSGHKDSIPGAWMVSTDGMPVLKDEVHYDTSGQIMLGEAFAQAIKKLIAYDSQKKRKRK